MMRRVPLVEHELLDLSWAPDQKATHSCHNIAEQIILLSLFPLVIVLCVLLRITDSDYPFGICNLLWYSGVNDLLINTMWIALCGSWLRVWICRIERLHDLKMTSIVGKTGSSEWLLFNTKGWFVQLCCGKNELLFDEMIMMSVLY